MSGQKRFLASQRPQVQPSQPPAQLFGVAQDSRAPKWAAWEQQRQADSAANDAMMYGLTPPPSDMPSNIPMGRIAGSSLPLNTDTPEVPFGGQVVQGQPMAPGQYEQMMAQQAQNDLVSRSRHSPMGRERALGKASEDIAMMWDKNRIDNAVMPAERKPFGTQVGSTQNLIAKLLTGQAMGID